MFLEDDGLTLNEMRCYQNLYTEFVFYFIKKCTIKNQCCLLLPPIFFFLFFILRRYTMFI